MDWLKDIYHANVLLWKTLGWICDGIALALGLVVNLFSVLPGLPNGSNWAKNLVLVGVFIWLVGRVVILVIRERKK